MTLCLIKLASFNDDQLGFHLRSAKDKSQSALHHEGPKKFLLHKCEEEQLKKQQKLVESQLLQQQQQNFSPQNSQASEDSDSSDSPEKPDEGEKDTMYWSLL